MSKSDVRKRVAQSLIDRFHSISNYASGEAQCNCCLVTVDNSDPFVTTFDTFPHRDDTCVKGRKYYTSMLVDYKE
jgi:hypothetical protein